MTSPCTPLGQGLDTSTPIQDKREKEKKMKLGSRLLKKGKKEKRRLDLPLTTQAESIEL